MKILSRVGCFFKGILWRLRGYKLTGHRFKFVKEYRIIQGIASTRTAIMCKNCGKELNALFPTKTEEDFK